ncbi:ankyrin repeat domain-containing protein [Paenibacillus glycanilyticus]|uniref:ankyrin repeat domain-containing protein n=1 Tax=Paenibacillus glycanilyticus TaxID=126569 RepID=UPI00203CCB67|nr:ankyrin repeat domain-containing protein [Paenibacillus glycanilyticus]MCM3630812.1 ankyrin repeat domain-containing protein [Paenibacillus glycanilyticus]
MELQPYINDLFQAAQNGDAARVKEIVTAHPRLANTENQDGLTPLGYAAHFGHPEVVRALLALGADVNALSHSSISFIPSNTALHAAIAGERSLEVIKLLLAHGADTTILDSNGHTCLHAAAFHDDNLEMIRLLMEHGADVRAAAEGGETALSLAIQQGNENVASLLREYGASV